LMPTAVKRCFCTVLDRVFSLLLPHTMVLCPVWGAAVASLTCWLRDTGPLLHYGKRDSRYLVSAWDLRTEDGKPIIVVCPCLLAWAQVSLLGLTMYLNAVAHFAKLPEEQEIQTLVHDLMQGCPHCRLYDSEGVVHHPLVPPRVWGRTAPALTRDRSPSNVVKVLEEVLTPVLTEYLCERHRTTLLRVLTAVATHYHSTWREVTAK